MQSCPIFEGPSCPVCGQGIDPSVVRTRLQELEGSLSTVGAQQNVAAAASAVAAAESNLEALRLAQQDAASQLGQRRHFVQDSAQLLTRISDLWSLDGPFQLGRAIPAQADAALLDRVSTVAARIAALGRESVSAWDASASSEESTAQSSEAQARARVAAAASRREQLARAHTRARSLYEALRQARVEVVRREFARLGPLAQDIYSRLDPHPTFRDIDLVSEMFRSAGTTMAQVSDTMFGVAADPMIVFSSAQANIAAISYLMSLNLASSVGAPVILLDDPLQAMDDVNVLGFADLCRHLRTQRQLLVSTHESRFAELLERKLAPRRLGDRTIALEFVGWDRNGPTIKPRDVPDQTEGLSRAFVDDVRDDRKD